MKINVTRQHIEAANRLGAGGGPVSLALTEALDLTPGRVSVVCDTYGAWIRIAPTPFSREHSLHVIQEIQPILVSFMDGADIEPFSFELFLHSEHIETMAHGWNTRKPVEPAARLWIDKTLAKLGLAA